MGGPGLPWSKQAGTAFDQHGQRVNQEVDHHAWVQPVGVQLHGPAAGGTSGGACTAASIRACGTVKRRHHRQRQRQACFFQAHHAHSSRCSSQQQPSYAASQSQQRVPASSSSSSSSSCSSSSRARAARAVCPAVPLVSAVQRYRQQPARGFSSSSRWQQRAVCLQPPRPACDQPHARHEWVDR